MLKKFIFPFGAGFGTYFTKGLPVGHKASAFATLLITYSVVEDLYHKMKWKTNEVIDFLYFSGNLIIEKPPT